MINAVTHELLRASLTNTLRSAQALQDKLSPGQRVRIEIATERAAAALQADDLGERERCLAELEDINRVIVEAMQRP